MPSTRPGCVDLAQLTDALASLFEGTSVYVNRNTGEIFRALDSDLGAVEDGEDDFEPEGGDVGWTSTSRPWTSTRRLDEYFPSVDEYYSSVGRVLPVRG